MRHVAVYLSVFLVLASLATAQNILNNGGFEYGLMCYSNNVWSHTDTFGKGDYKFKLSTDAHSGNYSLEIACEGADCPKAAVFSNKIPTAPNRKYSLSVYARCPAGATGAVYIPNMAKGDVFQKVDCTGRWTSNVVLFQTPAAGTDFFFYLFSYEGKWVRFDDVVLTYADRTVPASSALHPGNRNVSVSSNALMVDGSPYLALGFFDVNYADLPQVAKVGANTIFGLGVSSNASCFNTAEESYLDKVYDLGLGFVPDSSTTARLAEPAVFGPVMQKFAPHQANLAWMTADEPEQINVPFWYMNPATFLSNSNAAKKQTKLPLVADFQRAAWSVPGDVVRYAAGVDLLMAEPYGKDFSAVQHATDMFKGMPPARPIWLAQDDPDANLIVPKAYWALVNGVTGIGYYSWPSFKAAPDKLAAVQQVFTELRQLKDAVFGQNVDASVTATAGIGYNARLSGNSTYIIAANPTTQAIDATIQAANLSAGQSIDVMFENRTISAKAGFFTDSFDGPARHVYVYKVPAPQTTQPAAPPSAR